MRIWVIKTGEPLPIDAEHPRLLRAGALGSELARRGHEVVWWSSTFDHARKQQRNHPTEEVQLGPTHKLRLIPSPGYQRNVSLARLHDHRVTAKHFERLAAEQPRPDLIFCALPTLELAAAAARLSTRHGIPLVTDVRDLWPDIFYNAAPGPLRGLARLALRPLHRMAKRVCRTSLAITGNAASFVDWGVRMADREPNGLDRCFPHGYHLPELPQDALERGQEFWRRRGVRPKADETVLVYAGALGRHVDFGPAIRATRALKQDGPARLIICGNGDQLERLRQLGKEFDGLELPGWVDAPELQSLFSLATLALAPYVPCDNYQENTPNKIVEYAANGAPVAVSLDGSEMHRMVREHDFGDSYGGDSGRLYTMARTLRSNPDRRAAMSSNATRVFAEQYDATRVYSALADHLERIACIDGGSRSPRRAA